VYLPGSSHGGFQPSHLTGQNEPSLSGGEKPLLIAGVAVGLRDLLFGLGVAFTARKHFDGSLEPTKGCPNSCCVVCAILITLAASRRASRHRSSG
jgi:hypothetical protein